MVESLEWDEAGGALARGVLECSSVETASIRTKEAGDGWEGLDPGRERLRQDEESADVRWKLQALETIVGPLERCAYVVSYARRTVGSRVRRLAASR